MRGSLPTIFEFSVVQKAAEGIYVSTRRRASAVLEKAHGGGIRQLNNANGSCWTACELKSAGDSVVSPCLDETLLSSNDSKIFTPELLAQYSRDELVEWSSIFHMFDKGAFVHENYASALFCVITLFQTAPVRSVRPSSSTRRVSWALTSTSRSYSLRYRYDGRTLASCVLGRIVVGHLSRCVLGRIVGRHLPRCVLGRVVGKTPPVCMR